MSLCLLFGTAQAASVPTSSIDDYVAPYAASNNFSGVVLIAKHGDVVYKNAFGAADIHAGRLNAAHTQFHLASLSMQFTAAAIMRLVELGKIRLDEPISDFVAGLPNGETITVRNLLEQTSGLPDVNALPGYADTLMSHQTAASLVALVKDKPPRFEPGGASRGEEHSAFNVLALVVERVTKQSFASALRKLVFAPLKMDGSGIDDDDQTLPCAATGYAPLGVRGLEVAQPIHWSAKTGNASAYATAEDLLKWRNAFFGDRLLSGSSRKLMLDYSNARVGYGWFKSLSKRFGVPVFYMNGRAPGFASIFIEVPSDHLTVIVLSNIYVSAVSDMGLDLAALMLAKPYEPTLQGSIALPAKDLAGISNSYRFDTDFFQPNATLMLAIDGLDASLRWPSGEVTYLIPVSKDHFVDRSYWVPVVIHRTSELKVDELMYDRFAGRPTI
jgi:CubicO group peptidase (beta-lactamase class C family)